MRTTHRRFGSQLSVTLAIVVSVSLAACATGRGATQPPAGSAATGTSAASRGRSAAARASDLAAMARAKADSARLPYTKADIEFMQGMIGHHSQAIEMSNLVPSHSENPSLRTLAERIINAQTDEIAIMRRWLLDRNQEAPNPLGKGVAADGMAHAGHDMSAMSGMSSGMPAGMSHEMMPGMLTPPQMDTLAASSGEKFDELFLRGMMQHHRGALTMVTALFATPGAGQDELVFKFASDVNVDQTTEIARMERMLFALLLEKK